jgi:N,N'-diacetyllegionaminate synthase
MSNTDSKDASGTAICNRRPPRERMDSTPARPGAGQRSWYLSKTLSIGPASVGPGNPAYVIAEAGVNHDGQLGLAKELVHAACEAEADAVKFQVFSADRLVTRQAPTAGYQQKAGAGASQHEMLSKLELTHDQFAQLYAYAGRCGIEFIATPFSVFDLRFLVELGVRAIKLASPDVVNAPILDAAAAAGLPLILSTGAAEMDEISAAVERLRFSGCDDFALLHCVSSYPAKESEANLAAIGTLSRCFDCVVGYSDHTESIAIGGYAAAAGASAIEKHFTLDRRRNGPDHAFSLEPESMTEYIRNIRRTETLLGTGHVTVTPAQREVRSLSRTSLVAAREIRPQELITPDALAAKRPGDGICPMEIDLVAGRRARRAIPANALIDWDSLD